MARREDLPKVYDPRAVEAKRYARWEELGYFRAEPGGSRPPFSIVMPPPNVTGSLHMGHALDNVIQDVLIRRRRMQGYAALWLPGTDHAGIATQAVVERELAREGLTRHELGRELFLERVWNWKERAQARIVEQLKRLGSSADWSRERFTLDEGCSRAVTEVFVRLYEEGLIYRGERIINWCPRCLTALSDIEVEHREVEGELVTVAYPLADGSGEIRIATTRVETMLADTGVAVHPADPRYAGLVGKEAVLPLVGRVLPILADEGVDPEFGTGAVKVTPAHDPLDFEIGQRHGLPKVDIFTPDARVSDAGGAFRGMDRYEARRAVFRALEEGGYLRGVVRPYLHAVGHCYRCGTEVEPRLSTQWFVRVEPLARAAVEAVREGRVRFFPERWSKVFFDWMEGLKDWCISRQIWWGHRIPAWYCEGCGEVVVAREEPASCPRCSGALRQDEDVLDTWFSSALWPFSTLGWPEATPDLAFFYPTSVLVTGYDIITFWVSRMIMMGLHFVGDVPFRHVAIHGLVRDWRGKKMSKSFGNVIDPLEMVERYGADALRFTLARSATPGQDVPLAEEWVEGSRNFMNKIWNAARFVLMNRAGESSAEPPGERGLAERWILSRLARAGARADEAYESYDLAEAARVLHHFFWSEYCDWYLEVAKVAMARGDGEAARARKTLLFVLDQALRLLHPLVPFIADEIWTRLTGGETVATASWPTGLEAFLDPVAEDEFETVQKTVVAIRKFRQDHGIAPTARLDVTFRAEEASERVLAEAAEMVSRLAGLARFSPGSTEGRAKLHVRAGLELGVAVEGFLDVGREIARLRREEEELEAEAYRVRARLGQPGFLAKAPPEVVEGTRRRLAEAEEGLARVRQLLAELEGLQP